MTNENATPDWLIPSKVYDVLKWVGLVVCPALAVLFGTVAQAWGMESATANAVVLTINAVGTFVGIAIGASQIKANTGKEGADE